MEKRGELSPRFRVINMKIIAFGEILWDVFGDEKTIGGAPFNFAAHIARLGAELSGIVAPGGGINVEFAKAVSKTGFRMRVYERGCGVTSACGTGACACAAAAAKAGLCLYETPLTAALDGGELELTVLRDSRVLMKGPAEYVFEGETVSP